MANGIDPFQILLSLGSGFATGAAKRKRENELLQLEQKEREVQRREKNVTQAIDLALRLGELDIVEPETLLTTLPLIRQMALEGRPPVEALQELRVAKPEPKKPKLSEKASILNAVRQARNLDQIDEQSAINILRKGGFSEEEISNFARGRQPAIPTAKDKKLDTLNKRADDLRLEISELRRQANEKDPETDTFVKTKAERKKIEAQIKAKQKTLDNIEKRREKITGVKSVPVKDIKITDFPEEAIEISTLIEKVSTTPEDPFGPDFLRTTKQDLINQIVEDLKPIASSEQALLDFLIPFGKRGLLTAEQIDEIITKVGF